MGNYAGDITASAAWDLLSRESGSVLVDVRTQAEWQFAGVPNLSSLDKKVVFLPWRNYPNYDLNESFIPTLETLGLNKDEDKIFFLCKVGGRSADAATAAANAGYKNAYNIESGMEGVHNELGQRGTVNGWKASKLPWVQA